MSCRKRKSSPTDSSYSSNNRKNYQRILPTIVKPPWLQATNGHHDDKIAGVGPSEAISNHKDVSSNYIDIGDNNFFCQYCHATFWYEERLKSHCTRQNVQYNSCCKGGKVVLPSQPEPPDFIKDLFKDRHFLDNIRAYNQMFNGNPPRFLQLYIYDTQNEVENRLRFFGGTESNTLKPKLVQQLIDFLNEHNDLVKLFRTAQSICDNVVIPEFRIRLYNVIDARQYDLPTSDTIGAIVFGNNTTSKTDYDVVLTLKDGTPQRVNKLHPSYMSLQFPLLFLYGQPGFHPTMKLTFPQHFSSTNRQRLTMNMYYAYQLHDRYNIYGLLLRSGRLFQQYVVTAYCSIELNRIDYIRQHQNDIRNEYLSGLYDAISRGDQDGTDVGTRIILPASFTGGPRYMYSHYLDALAICRVHGNPQFFITFTCNVKWPEIKRFLANYPGLTPTDRADIIVRVFQIKVLLFLRLLKEKKPFGVVTAVVYTIEFQKRGLPHCHTLLWVKKENKIKDADDVDQYISAEIPDPTIDPDGYKVVPE